MNKKSFFFSFQQVNKAIFDVELSFDIAYNWLPEELINGDSFP